MNRVEPKTDDQKRSPANEEPVIKRIEEQQSRFEQWKKGVDEAAKSPEKPGSLSLPTIRKARSVDRSPQSVLHVCRPV